MANYRIGADGRRWYWRPPSVVTPRSGGEWIAESHGTHSKRDRMKKAKDAGVSYEAYPEWAKQQRLKSRKETQALRQKYADENEQTRRRKWYERTGKWKEKWGVNPNAPPPTSPVDAAPAAEPASMELPPWARGESILGIPPRRQMSRYEDRPGAGQVEQANEALDNSVAQRPPVDDYKSPIEQQAEANYNKSVGNTNDGWDFDDLWPIPVLAALSTRVQQPDVHPRKHVRNKAIKTQPLLTAGQKQLPPAKMQPTDATMRDLEIRLAQQGKPTDKIPNKLMRDLGLAPDMDLELAEHNWGRGRGGESQSIHDQKKGVKAPNQRGMQAGSQKGVEMSTQQGRRVSPPRFAKADAPMMRGGGPNIGRPITAPSRSPMLPGPITSLAALGLSGKHLYNTYGNDWSFFDPRHGVLRLDSETPGILGSALAETGQTLAGAGEGGYEALANMGLLAPLYGGDDYGTQLDTLLNVPGAMADVVTDMGRGIGETIVPIESTSAADEAYKQQLREEREARIRERGIDEFLAEGGHYVGSGGASRWR